VPIVVSQTWAAVALFVKKAVALLALFGAKVWALFALPSFRSGLLVLGFVLLCYLLFALASWRDGVRWRRLHLPEGRRRHLVGAGIHRRRRCWTVVEGSGYEVHHERRPAGSDAKRRIRECWAVSCVSCGATFRDRHDEVAHFSSVARAALAAREQGWTLTVGDERCPTCSRFVDNRVRELQGVS
jgi:hypothetical protein